jgi:hypothetical protein
MVEHTSISRAILNLGQMLVVRLFNKPLRIEGLSKISRRFISDGWSGSQQMPVLFKVFTGKFQENGNSCFSP